MLIPILAFVALYAMRIGPIVLEIFPNRIRGFTMAISMISLYVSDFIVSISFPWMIDTLGNGVFHLFGGDMRAGFSVRPVHGRETRGKSREGIERMRMKLANKA